MCHSRRTGKRRDSTGEFNYVLQGTPGNDGCDDNNIIATSAKDDIEFGWEIVKKLGELDIGQAIVVKDKEVIAVEAIEGTAEMIERAGRFCKSGGWTLIKVSKPQQDMRFDVPCVGPDTIRSLAKNGGKCLVVEAGKTIIIDKPETIKLANQLGITIFGC